ncbi:MAG: N-carbamoyl-D-amino-acid hydrolase [Pseudomonadota bacterium]
MPRYVHVAGAQLGPIGRNENRKQVVARLMDLLRDAHGRGCELVVFPELALTTFFPRWWFEDQADIDAFFETEMPSPETQPLFDLAKELEVGFYLGYAELAHENGAVRHYNTSILMDRAGKLVGKYRKVHLPGHADNKDNLPFQHLEKRYFDVGDLGLPVWRGFGGDIGMCICNDRRWPETYRVMALRGAEMILLGYNTPTHIPWEPIYDHLTDFHNHLCMQAGAYQNSLWVVGTAKAGLEEGSDLIGGSCIISPSGEIVAMAVTRGDEVFSARCDLEQSRYNRETMFKFAEHRRIEHYGPITEQAGEAPKPSRGENR